MAAMNAYKDALVHKDGAALNQLLNPDLMYTHSGVPVNMRRVSEKFIFSITLFPPVMESRTAFLLSNCPPEAGERNDCNRLANRFWHGTRFYLSAITDPSRAGIVTVMRRPLTPTCRSPQTSVPE